MLSQRDTITKHYAHLAPNYVADTIRAAFGAFGIAPAADAPILLRAGRPETA
ncbi:hypothetical protein [Lichenicoccus sp.]|uniref:hypothetical protein n=1 Tax=Lichenicoccus sp. TaxID=2781899 RepID=UPI003D0F3683